MGLKRVMWVWRYQGQCWALRPLGHQGYRLRSYKKDQPLCSGYMGYADGCTPDTRNVRAPLDVRRDATTVQAPVWRPFAVSKEKVTGGVGLLNLLHLAKDVAQQTNRILPLLLDENIHCRILKLLYGAKNQQWNMRAYLRYVPVVYGVWHAYKFVVTHTFRVFWPVLTYLRKGLLRPGSTIVSYPKLIVMEKTFAALMLATPEYYARNGARHKLQPRSVVVTLRMPTGQQWQTQSCICCRNGARCCCTWATWYGNATGQGKTTVQGHEPRRCCS